MEAEIGMMQPQAKGCWHHQKRTEAKTSLLEALGGHSPADTLILNFWPPELKEKKTKTFCFNPPSLP